MKPTVRAAILAVAFLALLPATTGSAIPVTIAPGTVNPGTLSTALNSAVANRSNAYVETMVFSQSLSVGGIFNPSCPVNGGGHPCYQMLPLTQVSVTNPFPASGAALSGGFPTTRLTWVNFTSGCAPYTCPTNATIACDSGIITRYAFAPSTLFNRLCFAIGINFFHTTYLNTSGSGGNLPILNITRLVTFAWSQPTTWVTVPGITSTATATVNIASFSPSVWGNLTATKLTYWSVPNVLWILPYPMNTNWYLPNTTITWLNTTQLIPQTNYSFRSNVILANWVNYPTNFCFQCGAGSVDTGTPVIETYFVALTSLIGTAGNIGGNSSGVSGPGFSQPLPSDVVLDLGNITPTTNGNYTASITWTNPFAAVYANSYTLQLGVLTNASVRSLTYNGVPFVASTYLVTATAIVILPGVLSLPTGQAVTLTVTYTLFSPVTTTSTVVTLNGFPLTGPELLFGSALAVATTYGVLSAHRPRHDWLFTILSFLAFSLMISAWLTVGGPL